MFWEAESFNQSLYDWNMDQVTSFNYMFGSGESLGKTRNRDWY